MLNRINKENKKNIISFLMRNLLSFNDYKIQNRESIEENILMTNYFLEDMLLERKVKYQEKGILGRIKKRANVYVSNFVKQALSEEIKMGKELDKTIKNALKALNDSLDNMSDKISSKEKTAPGEKKKRGKKSVKDMTPSERLKEIQKILKVAKGQTYGVEQLINDGEIDFVGFMNNMSFANFRCFGVLFLPITNTILLRKCYNYFFGIIKQIIRKDLLIINLNFNYFENLVLTKTYQSEEAKDYMDKIITGNDVIKGFIDELARTPIRFSDRDVNRIKKASDAYLKNYQALIKGEESMMGARRNIYNDILMNQSDNTYTRSFETMKQLALEDSQKQLDAIKTSMQKIAQVDSNDPELATYVEMIISMAEENAYKASAQINNKFIKLCEAFSLPNQMNLVKLIQEVNEENSRIKTKIDSDKLLKDKFNELKKMIKKSEDILKKFNTSIEIVTDIEKGKKDIKILYVTNIEKFVHNNKAWGELSKDEKTTLEKFFYTYPDIREKITDKYLKVHFVTPNCTDSYIQYAEDIVEANCVIRKRVGDSYKSYISFNNKYDKDDDFDKYTLNELKKKFCYHSESEEDKRKEKQEIVAHAFELINTKMNIKRAKDLSMSLMDNISKALNDTDYIVEIKYGKFDGYNRYINSIKDYLDNGKYDDNDKKSGD